MEFVNEAYRKRMAERVNRKTEIAVKSYLYRLEGVFQDAVGYFQQRENLMKLEDKFYGTIAETKINMTGKISSHLQIVSEHCRTLKEASEDLFTQIHRERSWYEQKVQNDKIKGGLIGAAGTWGGIGLVGVVGAESGIGIALLEAMLSMTAVIPVIVGGVAVSNIAKKISAAKSQAELEKKTRECVTEFRAEVARTRKGMIADILDTVDRIFKNGLDTADKSFLDFRMSVNIDSKNIYALESKMDAIQGLMDRIEQKQEEKLSI